MTEYNPDKWKVIKITTKKETFYKIFATWKGGYLGADSWKLSSGSETFRMEGDCIVTPQASGSVYSLHKDMEGICGGWNRLYNDLIAKMRNLGAEVEELTTEQVLELTK